MSEINITYDLLFDVLRVEKSREDLQKIDDNFFANVAEYITSKNSILANPNTTASEGELTRIQLQNVRKILSELYERREKKILNLAIYMIKTSSGMINGESLLSEERQMLKSLQEELLRYRTGILSNILEGKNPSVAMHPANKRSSSSIRIEDNDPVIGAPIVRSVRFTGPVPKFLGPGLETYGPFEENDMASLPSQIADILIKKSRAEEIHTG